MLFTQTLHPHLPHISLLMHLCAWQWCVSAVCVFVCEASWQWKRANFVICITFFGGEAGG